MSARERDSSIDFSMLLSRALSAVGLLLLLLLLLLLPPRVCDSAWGGSGFERERVQGWGAAVQREHLQVKK